MTLSDAPEPPPDAAFLTPPFEVLHPDRQTLPVVFDSPHSGRRYPPRFLARSRLDAKAIRRSEDSFVDALIEGVVGRGAPLLRALFPRVYVDVNREPYELDPTMFASPLPAHVNTRSERVASGLGTIARIVADGSEIYRQKLTFEEVDARIKACHAPYHRALAALLEATHRQFGIALLVDCHSMPSTGLSPESDHAGWRSDIVLGDRFGQSCSPAITFAAEQFFKKRGYSVARNTPYAGGHIAAAHGQPARGIHVLQIEINRALYMNEARFEPNAGFLRMAADMEALPDAFFPRQRAPLAAE